MVLSFTKGWSQFLSILVRRSVVMTPLGYVHSQPQNECGSLRREKRKDRERPPRVILLFYLIQFFSQFLLNPSHIFFFSFIIIIFNSFGCACWCSLSRAIAMYEDKNDHDSSVLCLLFRDDEKKKYENVTTTTITTTTDDGERGEEWESSLGVCMIIMQPFFMILAV